MSKHDIARKHLLSVDSILGKVIQQIPPFKEQVVKRDPFVHLIDEIMSQQLSGKVADVIFTRFLTLFPDKLVTPERVLKLEDQAIRDVGTAWSKVHSIKDLALKVSLGEVLLDRLDTLTDEEVITELSKVKGIGRWTAEMFLMFHLERPDIFSHGDYGLRKAIKNIYNLKELPTQEEAEKISLAWSPYRTLASQYLWRSLDL